MKATRKGYYIANQYEAHFLTFTVVAWVDLFTRKELKDLLVQSMKYCIENKGLIVLAYVIMESHIHVIWRAKAGSAGLSSIIRDYKKFTSKQIIKWFLGSNKESRRDWLRLVFLNQAKNNKNNKNYQIWIQNNRPMKLVFPKFTLQKLNYIHLNPVKAKIVRQPDHYLYSSARNYKTGLNHMLEVTLIDLGSLEGFVAV